MKTRKKRNMTANKNYLGGNWRRRGRMCGMRLKVGDSRTAMPPNFYPIRMAKKKKVEEETQEGHDSSKACTRISLGSQE